MNEINKLENIKEKIEDLKNEYKILLIEEVQGFLKKYPYIESIGWRQGTPSWNDGDACRFTIYGFDLCFNINKIKNIKKVRQSMEDEDIIFDYINKSDNNKEDNKYSIRTNKDGEYAFLLEFDKIKEIIGSRYLIEDIFEGNSEIKISINTIEIKDYSNY